MEYSYVDKLKLYVTDPAAHEVKLQFVCAEVDSPLPKSVRMSNHLSIKVDEIYEAVKAFDSVEFAPVAISDKVKIAFAVKDDVLFELMEIAE